MLVDLHIRRSHPPELPVHFDSLLLVYDSVVQDSRDSGGIAFGRICMENDLPILQPLCSQRFPFRKLLSRHLGSMDPRSKISENSCPEILDPWILGVGSMDPRFLDGSKISGQEFSEILDLGSWTHGSKISGE